MFKLLTLNSVCLMLLFDFNTCFANNVNSFSQHMTWILQC